VDNDSPDNGKVSAQEIPLVDDNLELVVEPVMDKSPKKPQVKVEVKVEAKVEVKDKDKRVSMASQESRLTPMKTRSNRATLNAVSSGKITP